MMETGEKRGDMEEEEKDDAAQRWKWTDEQGPGGTKVWRASDPELTLQWNRKEVWSCNCQTICLSDLDSKMPRYVSWTNGQAATTTNCMEARGMEDVNWPCGCNWCLRCFVLAALVQYWPCYMLFLWFKWALKKYLMLGFCPNLLDPLMTLLYAGPSIWSEQRVTDNGRAEGQQNYPMKWHSKYCFAFLKTKSQCCL